MKQADIIAAVEQERAKLRLTVYQFLRRELPQVNYFTYLKWLKDDGRRIQRKQYWVLMGYLESKQR